MIGRGWKLAGASLLISSSHDNYHAAAKGFTLRDPIRLWRLASKLVE